MQRNIILLYYLQIATMLLINAQSYALAENVYS